MGSKTCVRCMRQVHWTVGYTHSDHMTYKICIDCRAAMIEWIGKVEKEPAVCSDKQVIEDAVNEAKADVVAHAKKMDVSRLWFSHGGRRLLFWRIPGAKAFYDPTLGCFGNEGDPNTLSFIENCSILRRQMTRVARRRKKLADKLRPKPYMGRSFWEGVNGRGWRWLSFWGAIRVGALMGMGGFLGSVAQQVLDQMRAAGQW